MKMKRILLLMTCLVSLTMSFAQPAWVKKASRSVFTLKTFAADGSLIASTNGFFIGSNGEAISNFTPFKGASRAVIIDAQGKEMEVVGILGANDMYDVVKFRVNGKTQPLIVSATVAPVGSQAWLLPYREQKSLRNGLIRKAEIFQDNNAYYTVAMTMSDGLVSCPLLNDAGEVIGMMQQPASVGDSLSYAVSARFVDSLKISGLSFNDVTLRLTNIKKELPLDVKEATLLLFLAASQTDSVSYATMINDFVRQFPNAPDGYIYRAQQACAAGDFSGAEQDMERAIKVSDKKDDAYFNYARLIYNKEIYQSNQPYANWNLDKALTLIREANSINPLLTYRQMEGNILYAQRHYQEACDLFVALARESNNAELWFSASSCKQQLNDTTARLALLDSTMNTFSKPYLKEAAVYLWTRAEARRDAGKFRDAVSDMNEYEELMKASITDNFYYLRHQTEIQGRLYQQALNDINRAIQINPNETLYYAEKASLEIRVGHYDNAIATARECIAINADNSDGFLFLGLAQCLKGDKQEGIKNLQKAKEMGDPQAQALIERYQ